MSSVEKEDRLYQTEGRCTKQNGVPKVLDMLYNSRPLNIFASHDWGADGANHVRVRSVVRNLEACGFCVWFDETHMNGNMLDAMCKGIDESDVVLVFVTKNYMGKVESGDDSDNVRREFMHAAAHPQKFIPVRFDATPTPWTGPVRMILGGHKYVDMVQIDNVSIERLVDALNTFDKHHRPPPSCVQRKIADTALTTLAHRTPPTIKVDGTSLECRGHRVGIPLCNARDRVHRIVGIVGDEPSTGSRHMVDVVDRLMLSVVGDKESVKGIPLVAKLDRLERELGIPVG